MNTKLTVPCAEYVKALLGEVYRDIRFAWEEGGLQAKTGEAQAALTKEEMAFRGAHPLEAAELLARRLDAAIVESYKTQFPAVTGKAPSSAQDEAVRRLPA